MAFRREKKRIGDMLINENVITQEQLEKALPIAKEKHKKIGETLIELGFTNELEICERDQHTGGGTKPRQRDSAQKACHDTICL